MKVIDEYKLRMVEGEMRDEWIDKHNKDGWADCGWKNDNDDDSSPKFELLLLMCLNDSKRNKICFKKPIALK